MNDPAASSGVSGIELPISLTPQAAGNSTLVGLKRRLIASWGSKTAQTQAQSGSEPNQN